MPQWLGCRFMAESESTSWSRAHDTALRVARTIADLDGIENLSVAHVSEAIQYRNLDREMWF